VAVRIEDFVSIVLLPLFFAVAGLSADIFLLRDPALIGVALVLVVVAIGAKLLAAAAAARLTGMTGRESFAIGALMNTRGLTELIVLSIGLELGVIDQALYTMLVIMALVTTFMAGPLLRLIDPTGALTAGTAADELEAEAALEAPAAARPERAIVAVALVGRHLPDVLAIATPLAASEPRRELLVVRLLEAGDLATGIGALNQRRAEAEAELAAARGASDVARPPVTAVLTSPRPGRDLVRIAGPDRVDLLVVDGRRSLGGGVLGGPVRSLLLDAPCDVAVLVRRSDGGVALDAARPIAVPFGGGEHDWAALELGSWLATSVGAPLRLLGVARPGGDGDPGRLLANASVVLQQLTGVVAETRVLDASDGSLLSAADDAALLVVGLSARWRDEGLGETRNVLAREAPGPVLFVRRGSRPGVLAPPDDMTRFTWSFAGAGGPVARSAGAREAEGA
jgi:hypothetical protein